MPIFRKHNKRILFIHVPKTGGTSIEKFFLENEWKMDFFDNGQDADTCNHFLKCSPQHMEANMLNTIFTLSSFDLIFMIVRNPIARIKSEFKWRKMFSTINLDIDYDRWIVETLDKYKNNPYIYDNHIRPQVEFNLPNTKIFQMEDGFNHISLWIEEELKVSFNIKIIGKTMKSEISKELIFKLSKKTKDKLDFFYLEDMKFISTCNVIPIR